jgi:Domain of unknown function (DUF6134)
MKFKILVFFMVFLHGPIIASAALADESLRDEPTVLDFDVYLDDKKVGKHLFRVSDNNGEKQVRSEANFNYKIFFFTAYQYEHSAAEHWIDDCLVEFDANTNTNGKRLQVSGAQSATGFVVENGDDPVSLPNCVMTFAYWNHEILDQPKLLNPQTGEYLDIRVEKLGKDILTVRGQPVTANRFKLAASEIELTIWYSADNEWLALESVAKSGHIIRYELS